MVEAGLAMVTAIATALWLDAARRASDAERDLAAARAGLDGARSASNRFEQLMLESRDMVVSLTARLEEERARIDAQRVEMVAKLDAVRQQEYARFQSREAELRVQLNAMAERLATIKLTVVREGDETFVADTDNVVGFSGAVDEPYAPELLAFLSKIETTEGKEAVEEFIERQRVAGQVDEAILTMLQQGRY